MGTALHKRLSKPKSLSRSQTRLWQGRTRRDRAGPISSGREASLRLRRSAQSGISPQTPLTFTTGSEQSPAPTPTVAPRVRRGQARGEEPRRDRGSRARLQGHLAGHRAAGPPPSAPHEPRERRSRRGGLGQARERRGGSGRRRALRHPARPRRGTCREAAPTGSELPGGPPPLLPGPSP